MTTRTKKMQCGKAAALFATAVSAAFTMSAAADTTGTYTTNGVEWTWLTVDNSGSPSYRLGGGSAEVTAMPKDTVLDASLIPWGYVDDGGDYRIVDTISYAAFKDCASLTGNLTIPSTVKSIANQAFARTGISRAIVEASCNGDILGGYQVFMGCSSLKGVLYKGHAKIRMNQHFVSSSALKLVVFGPQMARDTASQFSTCFNSAKGCKIFYSASQTSWESATDEDWYVSRGNEVIRYGSGQDFDMEFGDMNDEVTIYPTTETAVTNALSWVPLFKDALGLDMKIAITNRIEMSEGVEITASMLQNVTLEAPPWYLTFAVQNQTQLDNVLASVSADTPIIIDIEGVGKNQITVPEGRKVAILAKSGWTFGKKLNGIIISFR